MNQKIKTSIKLILYYLNNIFSFILRDNDTNIPGCPQRSFLLLFIETIRYKFAGIGISLTENEKQLLELKDKYRNKRAFVIGNGPSLNLCDLHFLKNEITFGVNNIYLNYEKMGFSPTYYVVEDSFVAEDRRNEINTYKGPQKKFFGNCLHYCIDDSDDVIWLNVRMRYFDYPDFPHFSTNAARMVWVGGTVSYICFQLAYYMGFDEIYLVGFDHKYTIPQNVVKEGCNITSTNIDPNHFDNSYFGSGFRWHDPQVNRMERAYKKAKKIFESDNRKIFNATVGGDLEVFQRVEYNRLFKNG